MTEMLGFQHIFTSTHQRDSELGFTRALMASMSGEAIPEHVSWAWMLESVAAEKKTSRYHEWFGVTKPSAESDAAIDWIDNVAVQVPEGDGRFRLSRPYMVTSKAEDPDTGHIVSVCFEVNVGYWADLLNSEMEATP